MVHIFKFLRIFIGIFQVFGSCVAPVKYNNNKLMKSNTKFILILSLINMIIVLKMIIEILNGTDKYINAPRETARVNEYFQILSPILGHLVFLMESFYFRQMELKMLHQMDVIEIDCDLISDNINGNANYEFINHYVWLFFGYYFLASFPDFYSALALRYISRTWQSHFLLRFSSFLLIRINHLQYLMYVCYIKSKLNFILISFESSIDINKLRILYLKIYKLNDNLNLRFGCTLTTCLLSHILIVIVGLYYIYGRVIHFNSLNIPSIFTPVPQILSIVFLFATVSRCSDVMSKMGGILHRRNFTEPSLRNNLAELHQFSHQIVMIPVTFSARGLFYMDRITLKNVGHILD